MDILFVENEEPARVGLTPLLEKLGHNVDIAENADDAVARMQQKAYGLVLLDIMIPPGKALEGVKEREAGKELLVRLRNNELGELSTAANVPVAAITAVSDIEVNLTLNKHAQVVLHKPMSPEDMLEKLSGLLEENIRD